MSNGNLERATPGEIEKKIPHIEGRLFRRNYIYATIKCPYCGKEHFHGVSEGMFGGYSHRVEHCAPSADGEKRYGYSITLPLADIKALAKARRDNFRGSFPKGFLDIVAHAENFIAKLNASEK